MLVEAARDPPVAIILVAEQRLAQLAGVAPRDLRNGLHYKAQTQKKPTGQNITIVGLSVPSMLRRVV